MRAVVEVGEEGGRALILSKQGLKVLALRRKNGHRWAEAVKLDCEARSERKAVSLHSFSESVFISLA